MSVFKNKSLPSSTNSCWILIHFEMNWSLQVGICFILVIFVLHLFLVIVYLLLSKYTIPEKSKDKQKKRKRKKKKRKIKTSKQIFFLFVSFLCDSIACSYNQIKSNSNFFWVIPSSFFLTYFISFHFISFHFTF